MKTLILTFAFLFCGCTHKCIEFKSGEVVKLKSGGPVMVVARCESDGLGELAITQWMDQQGRPQIDMFRVEVLEK